MVFFKPNDFLGSCRRRKCPEAWMLGAPKAEKEILHGAGVTAQACAWDAWQRMKIVKTPAVTFLRQSQFSLFCPTLHK